MNKSTTGYDGKVTDLAEHRQAQQDASEKSDALSRLGKASLANEGISTLFFEAWKDTVALAGESNLLVEASRITDADHLNQLRPDIEYALPAMSDGERLFLIAICQFYSDSEIARICQATAIE